MEQLSNDEQHFSAELVYKKQKNINDISKDMINISVPHTSNVDSRVQLTFFKYCRENVSFSNLILSE